MRIFISSTSEDLEAYRAAARDVVSHLGWQPVRMEDFGTDGSAGVVEACAKRVGDADVVLAILGWRRGDVPGTERGGDGESSFTKLELDAAFAAKKPVLVLMADDMWPGKLWEEDRDALAWVRTFRQELDRLAVFFHWEDDSRLPVFQSKVREELLRHQQSNAGLSTPATETTIALRTWPQRRWPDLPYPLLLPYSHPALFAGRQRELEDLRGLLRQPLPILGLYALSGAGKSSLLAAGLVPALRAEGNPVALECRPDEPGVAGRLIGDLLEAGSDESGKLSVDEADPYAFADLLLAVERLSGRPPLLVLDQFEDLMRPDSAAGRARLGLLLAASVRRRPGRDDPPCRWLLAYREDFHGRVNKWLGDVLQEARDLELPAARLLPHDLAGDDRFHSWPLPLLGAPPTGGVRASEPALAFREAIVTPLELTTADGRSRYPWRFAGDGAERLASAFAKAREAQPDAPLVPELQVVLAHVLKQASRSEGSEPTEIEVPEKLEAVIDQALEGHLHRALDGAFLGHSARAAREGRTRVLLALRQLADAEGKRGESLPVAELASASGERGLEILELLARRDTRILIPLEQSDGRRYALSHDRLAEVVVRAVEEEGLHGDLDRDLLALRRFVRLNTELYLSGERIQATRIPSRHFRRITEHAEALIRDEDREQWWAACEECRLSDRRRLAARSAVAAIAVVLISLGIWTWVQRRWEQAEIVAYFASGNVERMLTGVEEERRNLEVLRVVEVALPRLQQRSQDLTLIGTVAWALDYFPGRDPSLADDALALRQKVLDPLRRLHPPPVTSSHADSPWVGIPGDSFWMGSKDGEGLENEHPRHRVTLNAFRLLDLR